MPPELDIITDAFTLDPRQAIGIPFALVGAVLLAIGAQLQHRGVAKVDADTITEASSGLSLSQLYALLRSPSWVLGTLALGVAVLFQLVSLGFAPLIVVQPLGAIALVITAIVNSRVSNLKLDRESVIAIALCVGGIGLFVTIAAFTAVEPKISDGQLITILVILGCVLLVLATGFVFLRKKMSAIFYIFGAGVLFGFVATLAKVVINRILNENFEWLTLTCIGALGAAALLGSYFVQTAYSSGPPDLVIAGLTVIDPVVAVLIGIIVLGEAKYAPLWAVVAFVVAGGLAIYGVLKLARNHPQARR